MRCLVSSWDPICSWRIHSKGLAPQNYSGSIRHSDENGWLPPPGAMDSGRPPGILPNVGGRRDSGRPGSIASLDSIATVHSALETSYRYVFI